MRFSRASNGQVLEIAPEDEINSGGEARIYSVASEQSLIAKIYRRPQKEFGRKLQVMLENPPSDPTAAQGHASIAWPVDLLLSATDGTDAGYLMPRVVGAYPLFNLYNPGLRRETRPLFNYQYLYRTAHNLAAVIQAVHNRDYVIGDVNESNILVADTALITIVDTDSFQVRDVGSNTVFRCPVGKPEFTAAELQGQILDGVDRTPAQDRFGLAILIFMLLMEGTHPFAGVYTGEDDPPPFEERIRTGGYPHGTRQTPYRPLPFAPPIEILPDRIQQLFLRCFEDGYQDPVSRPPAAAWAKALREAEKDLIVCAVNDQHWYGGRLDECPWCRRTELLDGRDPFPSKERVLSGQHIEPLPRPVQTPLPSASTPPVRTAPSDIIENQTAPAPPPIAPGPAAPRITYSQRQSAPAKRTRAGWIAPVAIILIVGALALKFTPKRLSILPKADSAPKPARTLPNQPLPPEDQKNVFADARGDAIKGDGAKLKLLLEQAPELVRQEGKDRWTLLHFAAFYGQSNAVQALIDAGADVNAREKDGFTPLHLAAQEGRLQTVSALIGDQADLNAQENAGWTPLHFAAQEGRLDVAAALLANHADPNIRDKKGLTPLVVARKERRSQLIDLLIGNGGLP